MYIIRLQGGDEAVRRRQDEALNRALVGHEYIRAETPEEVQDLTGHLEGIQKTRCRIIRKQDLVGRCSWRHSC